MEPKDLVAKAQLYLSTLCSAETDRRTGSMGNGQATDFFARTIRPFGYEVDVTLFDCLDYLPGEACLTSDAQAFEVQISPYSLGCDVRAELVTVSTVDELERADCTGKLLLMHGTICAEQLMPKNFVFYNPDHHQKIIALLESAKPAGIITATAKLPEMAGALYPFPLFVDGDFDIPSVYCTDRVGEVLAQLTGDVCHLQIDAQRIASSATNIIAKLNPSAAQKIVVTAHIDTYEGTPGALDNASGTVVLLLLAEMLADYRGDKCIEITAFNGEDHYSVGGQMDYLQRYGYEFARVLLAINIDGVGYKKGKAAYSFYECPAPLEQKVESVFRHHDGLTRGEPWFTGDHMIFAQGQISSVALTSEWIAELMQTVIHTTADTPDLVDCLQLVKVTKSLDRLARAI